MLQHQPLANCFVVSCDQCGRLDSISTAKTPSQAKRIAGAYLNWEMDTPEGDLCRRCAWKWHNGFLERRAGARDVLDNGDAVVACGA